MARRDAASRLPRRHRSARWWLLALVVVMVLLVVAGNGGRSWWAGWLANRTNGNRTADFLVGLAVGLLPLLAVAAAAVTTTRQRALRMFVAGASGFVVTDLLAPSLATAIHDGGAATHPFSTKLPGYLTGVYTGLAVEVLLLVAAVVGIRRAVRHRLHRY